MRRFRPADRPQTRRTVNSGTDRESCLVQLRDRRRRAARLEAKHDSPLDIAQIDLPGFVFSERAHGVSLRQRLDRDRTLRAAIERPDRSPAVVGEQIRPNQRRNRPAPVNVAAGDRAAAPRGRYSQIGSVKAVWNRNPSSGINRCLSPLFLIPAVNSRLATPLRGPRRRSPPQAFWPTSPIPRARRSGDRSCSARGFLRPGAPRPGWVPGATDERIVRRQRRRGRSRTCHEASFPGATSWFWRISLQDPPAEAAVAGADIEVAVRTEGRGLPPLWLPAGSGIESTTSADAGSARSGSLETWKRRTTLAGPWAVCAT